MKYALVTGGSRGLGKAISIKLSQMGIPVIINYKDNKEAAESVLTSIFDGGGKAELLQFNVAEKEEVEQALDKWEEYLVNNAGIRRDNVMFMMSDKDWFDVINTSLNGSFFITRRLLPKMMMRKHGGRIINMASLSGIKGMAGQTNYSAAKAALIGVTKALAQETAARNVTVNAVAPGFIDTDMTKDLPKDQLKSLVPMNRFGKPEEVASLVAYLCTEDAGYITGEVISINGGLYT